MKKLMTSLAFASAAMFTGCSNLGMEPSPAGMNSARLANTTAMSQSELSVPFIGATNFAVLAGTTVTNDGESVITGDAGVSPGTALTGFQPAPFNAIAGPGTVTAGLGLVTGTIYAGGPVAAQAHNEAVSAYNYLVAQVPDTIYSGVTQLNGLTFTPGVYQFAPSANLQVNGTMYLDFQGNSDALFIFQMGSTLVTMTGSKVIALNNSNLLCAGSNVYWAVGSSATIDGSEFIGTVIATTSITMTSDASVSGRIVALNGAVTMIKNTISVCAGSISNPPAPKPCMDFVTGGGWISTSTGDKVTFGVSGGIKNDNFWGQLSFDQHAKDGIKVKSTSVTGYIILDSNTRQIEGIAKINGQDGFSYRAVVVDNGEPGRDDRFTLELSNGYSVSGILKGGNIQLHNCEKSEDQNSGKGQK